jgi:hypothetical protein
MRRRHHDHQPLARDGRRAPRALRKHRIGLPDEPAALRSARHRAGHTAATRARAINHA